MNTLKNRVNSLLENGSKNLEEIISSCDDTVPSIISVDTVDTIIWLFFKYFNTESNKDSLTVLKTKKISQKLLTPKQHKTLFKQLCNAHIWTMQAEAENNDELWADAEDLVIKLFKKHCLDLEMQSLLESNTYPLCKPIERRNRKTTKLF